MAVRTAEPSTWVGTLVERMTLEQKVAQLCGMFTTELIVMATTADEPPHLDPARLRELRPHGVGHLSMAWFLGTSADELREALSAIQAVVGEVTPFGIGALVHNEGINGF